MSNPLRAPTEPSAVQLELGAGLPDAYLYTTDEEIKQFKLECKLMGDLKWAASKMALLDMEDRNSFYIKRKWTVEKYYLESKEEKMALAKKDTLQARLRLVGAKALANRIYAAVPEGDGPLDRAACATAAGAKVFADGGAEFSLNRLSAAYPRRASSLPQGLVPITRLEAEEAFENSFGLPLLTDSRRSFFTAAQLLPFPLVPQEGERGNIRVNPKSTNGYPVLGFWNTPGAAEKVKQLAVSMSTQLYSEWTRDHRMGVWNQIRAWEDKNPELVTFMGKAKGDFYSVEKVRGFKLRFYNALPRQLMLIIQRATQPLEQLSRHLAVAGHSAIGLSLAHGGADQLVSALERQLTDKGSWAWVHVGDDSWVVHRFGHHLVLFSLDCSNFDLTQHSAVTEQVHQVLRDQLEVFDPVSGQAWYAVARERQVVTALTIVKRWKHGGASGMPLQSKVNDMLMDVLIRRLQSYMDRWASDFQDEDELAEELHHDALKRAIAQAATSMGFHVRLEDRHFHSGVTLREALASRPFLFIGYYFHVKDGRVVPFCDLARMLAQLPYSRAAWLRAGQMLRLREALRMGAIVLNMGIPPASHELACAEARAGALTQIEEALRDYGDVNDDNLRWFMEDCPQGILPEPSLSGLRNALQRDPALLWGVPLPSLRPLPARRSPRGQTWADLAEEADLAELEFRGLRLPEMPLPDRVPAPLQLVPRPVPTHPTTSQNLGRPPPTAVWGPDKPPRVEVRGEFGTQGSRIKGGRRQGRVAIDPAMLEFLRDAHTESEEEEWDEE